MRIVLADDDQSVRGALRLMLEELLAERSDGSPRAPSDITEAGSSEALLLTLEQDAADLVLLDWELPDLPVERLMDRARKHRPRCVVIAMSGRPEAARDAVARGADAFISKSEPPDRLIDALLRVLRAASASRTPSGSPGSCCRRT